MRIILILMISLMLFSCTSARVAAPRLAHFNLEEYAQYSGTGTAAIYGEAFLRTRGGDVRTRIIIAPGEHKKVVLTR